MDVLCWSLGHQQPCYFPQWRCLFWQRKCPNVRFLKCSRVATARVHFISRRHRRYAFNEDGSQAWMFQSQWCVQSPLNQKCVGDLRFGTEFFCSSIYSNAEVAPSGNLYFGEQVSHVHCNYVPFWLDRQVLPWPSSWICYSLKRERYKTVGSVHTRWSMEQCCREPLRNYSACLKSSNYTWIM